MFLTLFKQISFGELGQERAGAVTTGKCPNRENVIAQLIPCIRQVSGKPEKCGEERAGAVATGKLSKS